MNSKHHIIDYVYLVVFILLSGLILFFANTSGEVSSNQSSMLVDFTTAFLNIFNINLDGQALANLHTFIRKAIGHFGLFMLDGIFGLLSGRAWLKYKETTIFIIVMSAGVFIASLSEVLQLLAPERGPSFADVLLDVFGYFIGVAFIYLILRLLKKNKKATG